MKTTSAWYAPGIFLACSLLSVCLLPLRLSAAELSKTHPDLNTTIGFPSGWDVDTDWMGGEFGIGAYVRFGVGAGGTLLYVNEKGSGKLDTTANELWFEGTTGTARQDFGFSLIGRYRIVVPFVGTLEDALPYFPDTDLRLQAEVQFTPYLLGEGKTVTLEDSFQDQELYVFPIGWPGILTGNIGASLTAGNRYVISGKTLETSRGPFIRDGEHKGVSISGSSFTVSNIYEVFHLQPQASVTPNAVIGVTVLGFTYNIDIPTFAIPVPIDILISTDFPTDPSVSMTFSSLCDPDGDGDGYDVCNDPDDGDPCNPSVCAGPCSRDADGDGIRNCDDPDENDPCNPSICAGPCGRDSDGDGVRDCDDPNPNDACNPSLCAGPCSRDADGDGVLACVDPNDNDGCVPVGCTVSVPDISRMTESAARSAISSAGLSTGSISYVCSDSVPVGEAISQSPAAGSQVSAGSAVSFTVVDRVCTANVHPADTNGDNRLDMNEVTGYGAAWKRGDTWPVGPNPIDMNYVTNAGMLWKRGETYHYDSIESAPNCWKPGSSKSSY